jgi:hypothetical protein
MIMASTTKAQHANHKRLLSTENKLEGLLQLTETIKHGNNKIIIAYNMLHDENTMLKTVVKDLTQQIMNQTLMPTPLSLTTNAMTSSTMEEISLQILDIEYDIQDMLDMV